MRHLKIAVSLMLMIVFAVGGCSSNSTSSCQAGDGKTVTTAAGLKYEELQVCNGTAAAEGKNITINYTGYVKDGDQQRQFQDIRGLMFRVGAGQVIRGLDLGVVGMKVGGKRRLTISPDLAYGAKGDTSIRVPSNATLIYDVELVSVAQ